MNVFVHYKLAQGLTILCMGGMALFTIFRARNQSVATVYALYNLAIVTWSASWLAMVSSSSAATGLFWARFLHVPAAFITATFFHFALLLTEVFDSKIRTWLKIFPYLLATFFSLLSFYPRFVTGVSAHANIPSFIDRGPLYFWFVIFFALFYISALAILCLGTFGATGQRKTQIMLVLAAYVIGFLGGAQAFLPVYDWPLPRYAFYLMPLTNPFIFYAIYRYGFLNPKIILRRAALMIGIYFALVSVALLVLFSFQGKTLAPDLFVRSYSFIQVIIVGSILSVGPFLYAYVVKRSSYFHEHEMAGITHDLKGPLGGIQGAIEMLQDLSEGKMIGARDVEYLRMIHRNTARLEDSVNNLLTVFKIPAKADAFDGKVHDLGAVIGSVADGFREATQAKGLVLDVSLPTERQLIYCDESKIRQVISNLLTNAIKYTRGGTVHISSETIGSSIRVTVRDTGEGISASELPRVFDRLFQGETSRKLKGSGLGLTIAKTWVEAHGGEIHAESDGPGKGSAFWFTLPK